MTDTKPAATRKPNGALIVLGMLVAAGFILMLMRHDAALEPDGVVDGGNTAEAQLVFDLEEDPRFKAGIPLRPMDRDIFAALKAGNLTREQMQDLFPERPYRVRVIGNVGEHKYGLVTVDLTRDGKLEERWDLRSPPITRIVPLDPNAPDNGPVKYTLSRGRWQLH